MGYGVRDAVKIPRFLMCGKPCNCYSTREFVVLTVHVAGNLDLDISTATISFFSDEVRSPMGLESVNLNIWSHFKLHWSSWQVLRSLWGSWYGRGMLETAARIENVYTRIQRHLGKSFNNWARADDDFTAAMFMYPTKQWNGHGVHVCWYGNYQSSGSHTLLCTFTEEWHF